MKEIFFVANVIIYLVGVASLMVLSSIAIFGGEFKISVGPRQKKQDDGTN